MCVGFSWAAVEQGRQSSGGQRRLQRAWQTGHKRAGSSRPGKIPSSTHKLQFDITYTGLKHTTNLTERLFIVTQTHNLQMFGVIPFV